MRRFGTLRSASIVSALFVVLLAAAGCSGPQSAGDGGTTTSVSGATTTSVPAVTTTPTPAASTTTVAPTPTLSEYDKDFAQTSRIQRDLSARLRNEGAGDDDPRLAVIYGLRARAQALTGMEAIRQGNLELADLAMRDVYRTLNLGRAIAEGTPAQILEASAAAVEDLGIPSQAPERAANMLDEFVSRLAPMLDEATSLVSSAGTG